MKNPIIPILISIFSVAVYFAVNIPGNFIALIGVVYALIHLGWIHYKTKKYRIIEETDHLEDTTKYIIEENSAVFITWSPIPKHSEYDSQSSAEKALDRIKNKKQVTRKPINQPTPLDNYTEGQILLKKIMFIAEVLLLIILAFNLNDFDNLPKSYLIVYTLISIAVLILQFLSMRNLPPFEKKQQTPSKQ